MSGRLITACLLTARGKSGVGASPLRYPTQFGVAKKSPAANSLYRSPETSMRVSEVTMVQWRPIPEYPGYEASEEGRIRGARPQRNGLPQAPQIICPWRTSRRHDAVLAVHICDRQGRRHSRPVSRLVLSAFGVAPPGPFGYGVVYVDGNSQNLRLSNLRWRRSGRLRQVERRIAA